MAKEFGRLLPVVGMSSRRSIDGPLYSLPGGLELGVFQGYEMPENLTSRLRRFGPTHVLLFDAADLGRQAGEAEVIDVADILDVEVTTHRMPVNLLVEYLEKSIGCKVIVVGIQPQSIELGEKLSPMVMESVRCLAEDIISGGIIC
jgi:hydrogenase 3 maturation protease